MQLASDFLLPATKSRDTNGSISNVFTGNYWSSSPDTSSSDSARLFSFSTSDVTSQKSKYRSNGYSVRCFKNTKNTDSLVLHAN